jgi:hypothetical protein
MKLRVGGLVDFDATRALGRGVSLKKESDNGD